MLMNVIRGAIAMVVFFPCGVLGQEGLQCMRDVLEMHAASQGLASLTRPKSEISVTPSECHPDGRHFVCTYTDLQTGPKMPANLGASLYQLNECFRKYGRKDTPVFDHGGEYYVLPKERCSTTKPASFAFWSFVAVCSRL